MPKRSFETYKRTQKYRIKKKFQEYIPSDGDYDSENEDEVFVDPGFIFILFIELLIFLDIKSLYDLSMYSSLHVIQKY